MADKKLPAGLTTEPGIRNGQAVTRYVTSDGYRYTNQARAIEHQKTVNGRKGKS